METLPTASNRLARGISLVLVSRHLPCWSVLKVSPGPASHPAAGGDGTLEAGASLGGRSILGAHTGTPVGLFYLLNLVHQAKGLWIQLGSVGWAW